MIRILSLVFVAFLLAGCASLFGLEDALADDLDYSDLSGTFTGEFAFDSSTVNTYSLSITAVKLCELDDSIFGYDATLRNLDTSSSLFMTCTNVSTTGQFECANNDLYDPNIGKPETYFMGRLSSDYKTYSGTWRFEALGFAEETGTFYMTRTANSAGRCL